MVSRPARSIPAWSCAAAELPHRLLSQVDGVGIAAIEESGIAGLEGLDGCGSREGWWRCEKVF